MIRPDDHTILIEENGHLLAHAEVYPPTSPASSTRRCTSSPDTCLAARNPFLVDAVLEHPSRRGGPDARHDADRRHRDDRPGPQRTRCDDVAARAAGATKLVEARLEHRHAPARGGARLVLQYT